MAHVQPIIGIFIVKLMLQLPLLIVIGSGRVEVTCFLWAKLHKIFVHNQWYLIWLNVCTPVFLHSLLMPKILPFA